MSLLWSSRRLTVASPAEPVLLVALLGFEAGEALAVESALHASGALGAQWRAGPPASADLWIANGRDIRTGDDDMLGLHDLRFRPGDTQRPVAFAEPLPGTVEARFRFDPRSQASLDSMLATLGPWLLPRVVQQALIGHLIANAARFTRSTVIHVQDGDRLLAVMNFSGDTGVATDVTPAMVQRADWHLRPPSAGFVPSIFHRAPTEEVLWRFGTRARGVDVLPSRYFRLPIYLRRTPAVGPDEISPRQAVLAARIASRPGTFRELLAGLAGLDGVEGVEGGEGGEGGEGELRRDLAALYLVGAITCDPGRAIGTARRRITTLKAAEPTASTGSSILKTPARARPGASSAAWARTPR